MKEIGMITLAIMLIFTMPVTICGEENIDSNSEYATVAATGISLDKISLTLTEKGQTEKLVATVFPLNVTNGSVEWKCTNQSVAIVSSTGEVTAVSNGTAAITVTTVDGNYTATCIVVVDISIGSGEVVATGITLDKKILTFTEKGQTENLVATINPSNATNRSVEWRSTDSSVAVVSSTGTVTAVSNGRTEITVSTADGNYTKTCIVVVYISTASEEVATGNVYTHNFTTDGVTSDYYTIIGDLSQRDSITYEGFELTTVFKTNSKAIIVFPTTETGTLILVHNSYFTGATIKIDGTEYAAINGVLTVDLEAGLHTISKGNKEACIYYMKFVPEDLSSGNISTSVTSITLDKTSLTLTEKGQTATLVATILPSNAVNKTVTWISSNTSVATVSETGVVTAVSNGTASIVVKSVDGNYTATCVVVVDDACVHSYIGTIESIDKENEIAIIDEIAYAFDNELHFDKAIDIYENKEDKRVVIYASSDTIYALNSIDDFLSLKEVNAKGSPITYQDYNFNVASQDIQLRLRCDVEKYQSLFSKYDDIGITIEKIKLTLPEVGLNFGEKGLIFKETVKELEVEVNETILKGNDYIYDYEVFIDEGYEPKSIPSEVIPLSILVTTDKGEYSFSDNITIANLDYQRQRAEEKKAARESKNNISTAKSELQKLCNGDYLALGPALSYYLNNNQIAQIEAYLYCWIAEVNNSQTFTDDKGINKKIMEKLGINPNVGFFWTETEAVTTIRVNTLEYGVKDIEFTLNCGSLNSNGNTYASFGKIMYEIKEIENIPKDIETSGLLAVTTSTYGSMGKFITCMQEVAEDSIKDVYKEVWGNNADEIAGLIVDETIMKLIDNKYGTFSNGVYTLITNPTKSTKKIKIECPVDVYVYDLEGQQVGAIIDNVVDLSFADIVMMVEGDTKIAYLASDSYQIKLVGNDTGTMTYTIEELGNDMEILRTVKFNDLSLNEGKTYTGHVFEPLYVDNVLYSLKLYEELILADEDSYDTTQDTRIYATGITIDVEEKIMNVEETFSLSAKVVPENATNKKILWSTSDETIATVTDNGTVTAIKEGSVTITAIADDGKFEKVCIVTVDDGVIEPTPETGVEAFVERMYTVALNRASDEAGKANWVYMLNAGTHDGAGLANEFILGEEFELRGLTDEEYVDVLYKTFFNRDADEAGKENWLTHLELGYTREYVLSNFVNLDEFTMLCDSYGIERGVMFENGVAANPGVPQFVNRLYDKVMGRNADAAGLYNWVFMLVVKAETAESAAVNFFNAEEYGLKNADSVTYVTDLYSVFMDREADADGLAFWVSCLDEHGVTRDWVISEFAKSEEFKEIATSYGLE